MSETRTATSAADPQPSTVLDKTGTVRAHELATVLVIDADAAVWADRL